VQWPVGLGGKGSEGVTGVVKQTPGGIGYVELTYAKENNVPVASVRNQAANWVEPSPAGTTGAHQCVCRGVSERRARCYRRSTGVRQRRLSDRRFDLSLLFLSRAKIRIKLKH